MPVSRPELEALVARAQSTFGLSCDLDRLETWVRDVTPATATKLEPGLVLACELFHRAPAALTCFEDRVVPRVKAALAKLGAAAPAIDEHVQAMRTRLLVDEAGGRLKHYRGVGSFEAFVITIAVRGLATAHRGPMRNGDDDPLERLPAAVDLERQLARTGQRHLFSEAFREALTALSPRERALLKLNLVDGASIDELAPLYQVSRATVARWLASARQALRQATLDRLSRGTRLEGVELDGLMASLESGFDVSLRRFVEEAAPGDVSGDE